MFTPLQIRSANRGWGSWIRDAAGYDRGWRSQQIPKREHLPSVSAKVQRMYEHIKESEQEQGRSKERAKAIAAATVVKHHNQKGHAAKK